MNLLKKKLFIYRRNWANQTTNSETQCGILVGEKLFSWKIKNLIYVAYLDNQDWLRFHIINFDKLKEIEKQNWVGNWSICKMLLKYKMLKKIITAISLFLFCLVFSQSNPKAIIKSERKIYSALQKNGEWKRGEIGCYDEYNEYDEKGQLFKYFDILYDEETKKDSLKLKQINDYLNGKIVSEEHYFGQKYKFEEKNGNMIVLEMKNPPAKEQEQLIRHPISFLVRNSFCKFIGALFIHSLKLIAFRSIKLR